MANEKNLIPGAHTLTVEDQSKGGKNSAKARKRRKSMKALMEKLLRLPASSVTDWDLINEMGIDVDLLDEEITNLLIVNIALLKEAKSGNIKAIKELREVIGDNPYFEHKKKQDEIDNELRREKLELDKKKAESESW